MPQLPPFPVDDVTLNLLEHALEARLTIDDEGHHVVVGADMSVNRLLDFLSGYDETKVEVLREGTDEGGWAGAEIAEYTGGQLYTRDCVIRALIAEVRRLRDH